jgi:mRNA interferase MazF
LNRVRIRFLVGVPSTDSVERVSVGVLVERIGRLSDDRMSQICTTLDVAVDCHR